MTRARVWLAILTGCLLLSIGLVLLLEQPDEAVRILRRHGNVQSRYFQNPKGPATSVFQTRVPGPRPEASGVYQDLVTAGWRASPRFYGGLDLRKGTGLVELYFTGRDTVLVSYTRGATPAEQRLSAIKKLVSKR
jgi:hypothetical protein